jgi:DNA-directed RNA polymerase
MGWIEGLVTFIATYYRELTKAMFGTAKAWHVTTHLAKRVLDDVGTIRQSAQGDFEAGNAVKICQNIVWAVFKAHDVMAEYKQLSFKNHGLSIFYTFIISPCPRRVHVFSKITATCCNVVVA